MSDRVLNQQALAHAITQIGVKEDPPGSNKGKEVEAYLRSVGLPGGYAWCAAFVYWCHQQAADELEIPNPVYRTAGVMEHWRNCHLRGGKRLDREKTNIANIKPGMIFVMDFGGGKGHTGIVESVDVEKRMVFCIEGNTNEAGHREGIAVMKRVRPWVTLKGFIEYAAKETAPLKS